MITVTGNNLDVVQEPRIRVTVFRKGGSRRRRRRNGRSDKAFGVENSLLWRHKRIIPEVNGPESSTKYVSRSYSVVLLYNTKWWFMV